MAKARRAHHRVLMPLEPHYHHMRQKTTVPETRMKFRLNQIRSGGLFAGLGILLASCSKDAITPTPSPGAADPQRKLTPVEISLPAKTYWRQAVSFRYRFRSVGSLSVRTGKNCSSYSTR